MPDIEAELNGEEVKIWDEEQARKIHDQDYYGKLNDEKQLNLALFEAAHLLEREKITLTSESKQLNLKEAKKQFSQIDSKFNQKYKVYKDLRKRGLIVKTGFKFGTHFRVYPRGTNPYEDQENRKHTKWVVQAVKETEDLGFEKMSRAIRLAQNVRAKMLWGVVDSEENVTYYESKRVTP